MSHKKKFFIHIGGPKTGSSAIQRYFFFNRDKLKELGLGYIDKDFGVSFDKCISHNNMLIDILNMPKESLRAKLKVLNENESIDQFILSSEGFSRIKDLTKFAEQLSTLQEYFDIKIILYIRNQIEFLYSGWQQWGIKRKLNFSDWVDDAIVDKRANWWLVASTWASYFKKEDIYIKVYHPKNLIDNDIVDDFLNITKLPKIKSRVSKKANYTFSDSFLLALIKISEKYNLETIDILLKFKKNPPDFLVQDKKNLVLNNTMINKINQVYYNDNVKLFQDFSISDESKQLFFEPRIKPIQKTDQNIIKTIIKELEKNLMLG